MTFLFSSDRHEEDLNNEYQLGRLDGWNAAIEAAATFMEERRVSASKFYADELRKMKR